MKLPNATNAVVELRKLVDYCLNPDHPRGKHKARVFESSCGLSAEHVYLLRDALLGAAKNRDAAEDQEDDYGKRFVVDLEVKGPHGTAQVRSVWIVRKDEDFPRFVTCYVT